MDKELEEMFDKQQTISYENHKKLQDNIDKLNTRPHLRDYLFK